MNSSRKRKILLIEPSQIVAAGLSSIIGKLNDFSVSSILTDLTYFTTSNVDMYDIILLNPVVVSYNQRTDIRAMLNIGRQTSLVAICYGPYEDGVMFQYDGIIGIYDSMEQICKKFRGVVEQQSSTPKSESKDLSVRERAILAAVAQGKTNKEIAEEFSLSIYTVVTHRKNISHKLGISSISGLTVYAIINKLIDVADF